MNENKKRTLGDDLRDYRAGKISDGYYGNVKKPFYFKDKNEFYNNEEIFQNKQNTLNTIDIHKNSESDNKKPFILDLDNSGGMPSSEEISVVGNALLSRYGGKITTKSEKEHEYQNTYKNYNYSQLKDEADKTNKSDDSGWKKEWLDNAVLEKATSQDLQKEYDNLTSEWNSLYNSIDIKSDEFNPEANQDDVRNRLGEIEERKEKIEPIIESKKYDEKKKAEYDDVIEDNIKAKTIMQRYYYLEKGIELKDTLLATGYNIDDIKIQSSKDAYNYAQKLSPEEKEQIKEAFETLPNKDTLYKYYKRDREEQETAEEYQQLQKYSDEHPVLGSLASVGLNTYGSVADTGKYIGAGVDKAFGGDGYINADNTNVGKAEYIRENVSEDMGDAGKFFYNTGMSIAENVARMPLLALPGGEAASLALAGTSSGVSSANDVIKNGGSIEKALMTGAAAGAAEIIFEKIPLDNLIKIKNGGYNSVWKAVSKQMVTEGLEELGTDVTNAITDQIINGDMSQLSLQYKNYIEQGYSKDEAWKKCALGFAGQLGQSFAGGAISGGVLGGGASAINAAVKKASKSKSVSQLGREAMQSEGFDINELIKAAKNSGNEKAVKIAEGVEKTVNNKGADKVSPGDVGNLLMLTNSNEITYDYSKNPEETIDADKQTLINKNYDLSGNKVNNIKTGGKIKTVSTSAFGKSHPNGIAAKTKSGEKISIAGVQSSSSDFNADENSVVIITGDNKLYDANDVVANVPHFNQLLDYAKNFDTVGARVLMSQYEAYEDFCKENGKTADIGEYAAMFNQLYSLGAKGVVYDSVKQSGNYTRAINTLGGVAYAAVKSGNNDFSMNMQNADDRARKMRIPGEKNSINSRVSVEKGSEQSVKVSDEQLTLLQAVAEKTGREIILTDKIAEKFGNDNLNGVYSNGKIYINAQVNNSYLLSTALHEAMHGVRQENPAEYHDVCSFITNYLVSKGENIDYLLADIRSKWGADAQSDEDVLEELVCQTVMSIAADEAAIKTALSLEENKGILKKVASALKKIAKAAYDFIKGIGVDAHNLQAQPWIDDINALNELAKRIETAFESTKQLNTQAAESTASEQKNNTDNNGGVKYSVKDSFYTQFNNWDGNTIGFSFVVGTTSESLIEAGVPNKQIRWDASKVKALIQKHNGMTSDVILKVPKLLENPIIVIDSKQNKNSKIVIGDLCDANNKLVTVVLLLTPTSKKGNQLDIIKVSSAQGRSHIESLFKYKDGTPVQIRYIDKNRIQSWLNVNRLQLPLHSINLDSNKIISDFNEKSNIGHGVVPSNEKNKGGSHINSNVANNKISQDNINAKSKFSYGGSIAKTADNSLLGKADVDRNNLVFADGGVSYSADDRDSDIKDEFEINVDKIKNNTYNSNNVLIMGVTPKALQNIGLNALPVAITKNHVYSIAVTEQQAKLEKRYKKNTNYHGLGYDSVKQIYEKIANPLMVIAHPDFSIKSKRDSTHKIVVLVDLNVNGKQVIAPIEVDYKGVKENQHIDVNLVATYFDKKNINDFIKEAIALEINSKTGFYYLDKKRTQTIFKKIGYQLPKLLKESSSSNIIIRKIDDNVNKKINSVTQSKQFIRWFGDWQNDPKNASKVVDENGKPLVVYHGTSRGDRVGNIFKSERATSGPMAFFTDNKSIADNYAKDKADTSIAYDEEYTDYYSQFRVTKNGKSISVVDLWNTLPYSEKARIKENAKHITFDDEAESIIYDKTANYGVGGFDDYRINSNNGNYISALIEEWLVDGNLYGEEQKFLEVLKLLGIENAEYRNPNMRDEKVYEAYLNIKNPFDTNNANKSFYDSLGEWIENSDMSAYERETQNSDMWDKNNQTPESWLNKLADDIERGNTHAWTVIPDFVSDYLKEQGYDGIKDKGGKSGGDLHTVWIPFNSTQIKSATDNIGTFDGDNPDIRYSVDDAISDGVFADSEVSYSLNPNAKSEVEKALADKNYRNEIVLSDNTPSIMLSHKDVKNLPMIMKASDIQFQSRSSDFGDYQEITKKDIDNLRNIGRKSINDFTSEDIKSTEKWAVKIYDRLGENGTKSPFFRAWFGDWRLVDKTPVEAAVQKGSERGLQKNTDTGWNINVSAKVFNETTSHNLSYNKEAIQYLPYINDIVKKAVLLDTYSIGKPKSENSLFMHSFYALADIGSGPEVLKLYVEEMYNPNSADNTNRAYQLQNIEKYQLAKSSQNTNSASSLGTTDTIKTISDLANYVKTKDKSYTPHTVNPALLNDDGTPKIFYHGTRNENGEFYTFDYSRAVKKGGLGLKAMGKGNYFTSRKLNGTERYGERIIQAYLRIDKPFVYNSGRKSFIEQVGEELNIDTADISNDELQAYMKNQGYDGVIQYDNNGEISVAVAFDSNQIKSATDNIGTFDGDNPDIRYAVDDAISDGVFADNDLFDDNGYIEQTVFEKALKDNPEYTLTAVYNHAAKTAEAGIRGAKDVELDDKGYLSIAHRLMNRYNISRKLNKGFDEEFAQIIQKHTKRIEKGTADFAGELELIVDDCKDALLLSGELDGNAFRTEREEILGYLHGKTLLVTDYAEGDIRETYGSIAKYRNKLFGRVNTALERNSPKGTAIYIDDVIATVEEKFPHLISDECDSIQGFKWLDNLINNVLQPRFVNKYVDGFNESIDTAAIEMAFDVTTEIIKEKAKLAVMVSNTEHKRIRQLAAAKKQAESEHKALQRAKLESYRNKYKEERENRVKQIKRMSERLASIKDKNNKSRLRYEAQVEDLKKRLDAKTIILDMGYETIREQYNERRTKTVYIERLGRMFDRMAKKLDGKANNNEYIPESLKQPILDVLSSFIAEPGNYKNGKKKLLPGYFGEWKNIAQIGDRVNELR